MNIELLKKLKENKCTDAELYEIYSWLCTPEKEAEATAFLKSSWRDASFEASASEDQISIERMKNEVWSRIEKMPINQNGHAEAPKRKGAIIRFRLFYRIAAAVIVLLVASMVAWKVNGIGEEEEISTVSIVEKSSPRGQKATIFLSDGSKVKLNSSSSIRYASDFGQENRNIELVGEAFFEVAENPDLPFVVKSGDVTTTALGTSFNIRSYSYQKDVEVALVTGKTKVSTLEGKKEYALLPGQSAIFNKGDRSFVKSVFQPRIALAWKDGILYFKNASFREVMKTLEEWYDVDISVDYRGEPKKELNGINGEFKNQSLTNVMKIMSHARDFEYVLEGKKMEIEFNK